MCFAKMNLEIRPSFLHLGFCLPVQNPSAEISSLVQDDIAHVDDLGLAIRTMGCVRIMDELIDSHENPVNRIDRIIDHLADLVLSFL